MSNNRYYFIGTFDIAGYTNYRNRHFENDGCDNLIF